jgi:hypothetical protein
MKKSTLILVALALFACTLAATATYSDGYSGKVLDKAKECGCQDGQHDGMHPICKEICQGDKCGMHTKTNCAFDKCQEDRCLQCIVKEKCDQCAKTFYCDGICDECGEPCTVYEYCPSCGAKYMVGQADARCDVCGKDCFCFEKCEKCGNSHYFNGFCDECASKCQYLRCCLNLCDTHDESSCNCKEDAPTCDKVPQKCDCGKDNGNHAQSGLDGQFEQPVMQGNPVTQGEFDIVVPDNAVVINPN